MWYLTTEGIICHNDKPVSTPFGSKLVHRGIQYKDKYAFIVDRSEIWIYDDDWQKIAQSTLELNCLLEVQGQLLVGTEKARLAWVENGELNFIHSFDTMDNRSRWTTPWGGPADVRSLAKTTDDTIFANIHVGWVCRSDDMGKSWENITAGLHKDVHQVNTHPSNPEIVFAATAGGYHISRNGGLKFEKSWDDHQTYQRAVSCFSDEHVLVSVSSGPSGYNAKLYRSQDLGSSWEEVDISNTSVDTNINTYQISTNEDGTGYVILNNTKIIKTEDYGINWEVIDEDIPKCYQILTGME